MTTNTCDKCGIQLTSFRRFRVGFLFGTHVELCNTCMDPFVKLLQDEGLLSDELASILVTEKAESDFSTKIND